MKRPKEHVEVTKKGSPLRHRIKAKEKIFLRHVTWPENIHRSNHEKRRGPFARWKSARSGSEVQNEARHTRSPWTSTPPTEVAEVQVAGHFASLDPSPAGLGRERKQDHLRLRLPVPAHCAVSPRAAGASHHLAVPKTYESFVHADTSLLISRSC